MWQWGNALPDSLSIFRNWKTDGASESVGMLLCRLERGSPAPTRQPRPGRPVRCPVSLASRKPPGSFSPWGGPGTGVGLSAHPDPAPAGGVCLHRVIWFQSSEIFKLSMGTCSILNSPGWAGQTQPKQAVSPWATAGGLATAGWPPISRSRRGWGSLGPRPSSTPDSLDDLKQVPLPSGPQSPHLYSIGLIAGSPTAWVQILAPLPPLS